MSRLTLHVSQFVHTVSSRIALNNMVLNPSGNPEFGVEADLVQEHMNLLSKVGRTVKPASCC